MVRRHRKGRGRLVIADRGRTPCRPRLSRTGHTNKSAAAELGVSVNTIGTHLRAVFAKLDIQSRVQLANELHKLD